MSGPVIAIEEQATRPRNLLLSSEEIDCPRKALQAMAVALEVPGVRSVTTHVYGQSIFVVYAANNGERILKKALEEAGFPLLV